MASELRRRSSDDVDILEFLLCRCVGLFDGSVLGSDNVGIDPENTLNAALRSKVSRRQASKSSAARRTPTRIRCNRV